MTGSFHHWLETLEAHPGLLAICVTAPDQPPEMKLFEGRLSREQLDHALRSLGDAVDVAALHRLPPRQMRWIYERAMVYCVKRSDGAVLNLIVGRRPAAALSPDEVETMIDQFNNL